MNCHQLPSVSCRLLAVLLLLGSWGSCCAPGRTRYTRRPPKKLCPLVYKQHVPNTAELSPAASGPATSGIGRHDAGFSQLVPNYNEYIIFQDDEGTGEDRMMTPRAKERLDMLAVSVMNHWPGVRLRVLDSWRDGDRGQGDSLHQEGRAVDIATSDRDRGKLGMLARLAVEVQFDWVFYEHRGRVHCSVKTEPSSSRYGAGCFSADTEVRTDADVSADGRVGVRMDRLRVGDRVLTVDDTGAATYSPVLTWLHHDPWQQAEFLRVATSSGLQLSVTPRHLLFVLPADAGNCSAAGGRRQLLSRAVARLAERVSVGDFLLVGSRLRRERVETIRRELKQGVFAPLTEHGSVLADGALASCYAEVDSHQLAHRVLQPLRWWHSLQRLAGWSPSSQSVTSEVHWYARVLVYIAEYLLPRGVLPHATNQA